MEYIPLSVHTFLKLGESNISTSPLYKQYVLIIIGIGTVLSLISDLRKPQKNIFAIVCESLVLIGIVSYYLHNK
ncbi:hypothetical protein CN354_28435 [Bacillus cereus]|nr:hypothetical protein CN354_28435 [Bacillus cereus]